MLVENSRLDRVSAYIPRRLKEGIAAGHLPTPGEVHRFEAATLFCDISGFTTMAEELAGDGPRGAEELNRVLLMIFTSMISLIHDAGGYVGHFYGDAMSVIFPEENHKGEAAKQAWYCGQIMQQVMSETLCRVIANRPEDKNPVFSLTIRVGLGYGECVEIVIGDPKESLEYVVGGHAIDEAVWAEHAAEQGQVLAGFGFQRRAEETGPLMDHSLKNGLNIQHETVITFDQDKISGREASGQNEEIYSRFMHPVLAKRINAASADFLAEHRPVSTMFVQFEGIDYSADDVGQKLQHYYEWARRVVARYGGTNSHLNRVLSGDKGNQLHIIFGAPVAPDSPGQAVRCALAILEGKPDFITNQRIGLAVGKVFACPVGSEARREYTVVGDVVNLAARLTQVCPENSLVIDEVAMSRCRGWLEFEKLPPVTVKGKHTAVNLYRAIGERRMGNRLETHFGRWKRPIFGREKEIKLIQSGMGKALEGMGGILSIAGALGIGKSRLLAEGTRYWLEAGGQVLIGECQPHTSETPFGPWLDIWREFFDLQAELRSEDQLEHFSSKNRGLHPTGEYDSALLAEILGIKIDKSELLENLPAEARQARLFNYVRHCFQEAAQEQPLLIVLEDIHWADQASLDLIEALDEYLIDLPIFVAITYRDSKEIALNLFEKQSSIFLTLVDLPPEKANEMALSLLGVSSIPLQVERHLGLRDRDGLSSPVNPLFLEEAVRVMLDSKIIRIKSPALNRSGTDIAETSQLIVDERRLELMQVPDSIHGLLLARLDGLPAASRDVLQIASVIGRQFAFDILSRITPKQPQSDLVTLLNGLSLVEMVQQIHADPELTYLFQHAMTQEVAYESLPYARRQHLHAAIGEWLEDRYRENLRPFYPILAYHYGQTDIHDKGLEYAMAAAEDAKDIFANREAVELYQLAERHLTVLGKDLRWGTAIHLYISRGEVYKLLGDFAASTDDIDKALELVNKYDKAVDRATAHNLLAEIRYRQGNFRETITLTKAVINDENRLSACSEMARAYIWNGMAEAALLNYELAVKQLKKAEGISQEIGDSQRLSGALEALAYVHYSKQELKRALEVMQRGIVIKREVATPSNYSIALNNMALIQSSMGQAEAAVNTWDMAAEIAEDTSRNVFAIVLSNRAEVLSTLGRFEEAERDFKQAVNLFVSMDDQYSLAMAHLLWGYEHCLVRGQWHAAQLHFDRVFEIFDFQAENYPEEKARLLLGLGSLELEIGSSSKAAEYFQEALETIQGKNLNWWKPAGFYYMGLTSLEQGDKERARIHFQTAVDRVEERGCPDYLPLALLGLGRVEENPDRKAELLLGSIDAANSRARYGDRIYCLETAGMMLAELGIEVNTKS